MENTDTTAIIVAVSLIVLKSLMLHVHASWSSTTT